VSNTTVSIYREDWDWLKRAQLEISATKGEIVTLADVFHAMVETAKTVKEEALNGQ
jgi:hypothetical protein